MEANSNETGPVATDSKEGSSHGEISDAIMAGGASNQGEMSNAIPIDEVDKKTKKKYFEPVVAEPAPPPYEHPPFVVPAAVTPEAPPKKRSCWKRKRIWITGIVIAVILVILVAVLPGVLLSKRNNKSSSENNNVNSSGSQGNSGTSTVPSSSSTISRPPLPSPTRTAGDASSPMLNTVIDAVNILGNNPSTNQQTSVVKMFFQDEDGYLCEKSSNNGVTDWARSNSGNRIALALNATAIAAVSEPDNVAPIRVFFVNYDGYLADMFQDTYGGDWKNGSLVDRQYKPGQLLLGKTARYLSATWCSGQLARVFVQGDDLQIHAFQLVETKARGSPVVSSSTWSVLPGDFGGTPGISSSVNFEVVCGFNAQDPFAFVNSFTGIETTGHLNTYSGNETTPVTFPPSVASLYRPNTPVSAVFGNLGSYQSGDYNFSLLLMFPLPQNKSSLTPNPSIHMLRAYPYPPGTLNWTVAVDVDTAVVPYALGTKELFSQKDYSVNEGVSGTMPKAWVPLLMAGQQRGTLVLIYQTEDGKGIKVDTMLGGTKGGSYDAIVNI